MSRSPHVQGTRVSKILETMAHVCGHAEGGISPILKFPITMTALVRYNPETTSYHESMIPQREREIRNGGPGIRTCDFKWEISRRGLRLGLRLPDPKQQIRRNVSNHRTVF